MVVSRQENASWTSRNVSFSSANAVPSRPAPAVGSSLARWPDDNSDRGLENGLEAGSAAVRHSGLTPDLHRKRDGHERAEQPEQALGVLWQRVVLTLNRMNPLHGTWAWYSMFSVALTDLYIRLLMAGIIHEPRVIF